MLDYHNHLEKGSLDGPGWVIPDPGEARVLQSME